MNRKLIVVADLGRLKAFQLEWTIQKTPHLVPLEEVELEEAHHRVLERVTDMAGRRAAPAQKQWGAPITDVHNLELETRHRLIRRIAKLIEQKILRDGQNGCWFAAPKEIHHAILQELPEPVRARIEKNLSRDLTKADAEELLEQFFST